MNYTHEPYAFQAHQQAQPMFFQPAPYPPAYMQQHPPQFEEVYASYPHNEWSDNLSGGLYQEEYEDGGEVSTRPRLTREQVEVLETQFQANHKPSSSVKRQLAAHTNLSLPRVANWFQNRRAKAKQLKKQEVFENSQLSESQSNLRIDPSARSCGSASERDYCISPKKRSASAEDDAPLSATSQTSNVEAGWASLQRALEAANAAQAGHSRNQMPFDASARSTMPPPSQPLNRASMPIPRQTVASPVSSMPPWSNRQSNTSWAPPQAFVDTGFDFGFSESMDTRSEEPPTFMQQTPHHDGAVQQSEWQEGLATPTAISHCNADAAYVFANAEDLPLPAYSGSRRGSGADSLTANFDTFALASASPQLMPSMTPLPPSSDHLDIAARRKRPRPAALNSSALRSRSYGAMTSLSPSFRSGMTPPPHAIRHVKSTGHSLNAHFGGIRKPSSAQRSPINLSTFAEADALNHFMTQQAVAAADNTPQATPIMHVSPDGMQDDSGSDVSQRTGLATRYQLPATQLLTLATTSPPTTPFAAEFLPPGQAHPYMPHLAATQQYATFSDYTPPYSAGPLTNSSWSDAPLTSPDVPNFPPVTYIPSLGHTQKSDSFSGSYQQFMLPSDNKLDYDTYSAQPEQKKTEFFIQEFPNQKQEHAQVAQQLAQNKPKSYIFANSAPGDYDQA